MARSHLTGSLLCATALLSACGGGGGGNVASTPPPPAAVAGPAAPAPTPAPPAPAPTPAATTSVPSAVKVVDAPFGEQPSNRLVGPDRDRLKFDYDASTGIYSFTRERSSTITDNYTFGPADSTPLAEHSAFSDAEKGNFRIFGSDQHLLLILTNSSNNTRIVLSYLSYGLLDGEDAFVFGTETPASDMPRTGSATYQGIVDGTGFDSAAAKQQGLLGSTGSLTANFATGNVNTSLSLRAPDFTGTLAGSGTIGAGTSHFDGSLTGSLNGASATGSFLGGFYGPNAVEAGYVFTAATGSASNPGIGAVGAFVGKQ